MPRGIAVLACALFGIVDGLKVVREAPAAGTKLHRRLPHHEPLANRSHSVARHQDTLHEHVNSSLGDQYDSDAAHYCGCNSESCEVDVAKVEHELQNDLVLILGCSLDINAIGYFCAAVGAPVKNFATKNEFSYLAHCDVGKFTLAYAFHPGASPPPYFNEYAGTATTMAVVQNSVHDVLLQFGREPTAIIVDSSLWDVSNWWQRIGRPATPYRLPEAEISSWCNRDVPELLRFVQTTYPRSGVAFRTPPTVFPENGYGQDPAIIDAMVACLEQHKDPLDRLYGHFGFIDYHNFVDQVLLHATGPPLQTYYKDTLHPGPALSMMYMNRVLNWVRSRLV